MESPNSIWFCTCICEVVNQTKQGLKLGNLERGSQPSSTHYDSIQKGKTPHVCESPGRHTEHAGWDPAGGQTWRCWNWCDLRIKLEWSLYISPHGCFPNSHGASEYLYCGNSVKINVYISLIYPGFKTWIDRPWNHECQLLGGMWFVGNAFCIGAQTADGPALLVEPISLAPWVLCLFVQSINLLNDPVDRWDHTFVPLHQLENWRQNLHIMLQVD